MKRIQPFFGLTIIPFLLLGCAAHPILQSTPTSDCPKLLEQSRAAGVDYVPTLRKAAKGDDSAMKSLLELTDSPYFTTDAEECHIEALAELLNRLGDRQFAVTLSAESADVRRAVVNGLIIELADYPSAETSRAAFADKYPLTAATVSP